VVGEVLKALLRLLSFMDYDYSVVDSTKFTDWLKGLHELFIDVRVRGGETLFPVHAQPTGSEVEFVKGIPEGVGIMLGDGAFDAKPILNTIASRGYIPIVKRGSRSPGVMGLGLGTGHTMKPYTCIGRRRRNIRSTNSRVRR
jgi:hypothetical protein